METYGLVDVFAFVCPCFSYCMLCTPRCCLMAKYRCVPWAVAERGLRTLACAARVRTHSLERQNVYSMCEGAVQRLSVH